MRILTIFFILLLWLIPGALYAEQDLLTLPNGSRAYYFIPPIIKGHKYIMLIALHGKGYPAKSAYDMWLNMATENNFILLAPEGTGVANNYFDRLQKNIRNVVTFTYIMKKKLYFDNENIIVAGFSMGGGFALDLALERPELYSKTLTVFGFFQERHEKKLAILRKKALHKQQYYVITGRDDITCDSLQKGTKLLRRKGAAVKLVAIPGLYHSYPADFNTSYATVFKYFGFPLTGNDQQNYNNNVCKL